MKSIRSSIFKRRKFNWGTVERKQQTWFVGAFFVVCSLWIPVGALALPLISEVLYDDEGSDDAAVFVEISG
ncbi:hypothetical protein MK280_11975, partial [Myxococcota bacterium]|nr:hypothetical protein [Myxococcota bacterium]